MQLEQEPVNLKDLALAYSFLLFCNTPEFDHRSLFVSSLQHFDLSPWIVILEILLKLPFVELFGKVVDISTGLGLVFWVKAFTC